MSRNLIPGAGGPKMAGPLPALRSAGHRARRIAPELPDAPTSLAMSVGGRSD
jgi:hypothetical protein